MKGCEEDQVLITGFNILLGTLKSSKLCVESEMCGFTRSQLQCKIMLFVPSFLFVLPDWMNVLVSLDRLLAVCRHTAQFYRVHCTRKAAWIPISCLIVLLGIALSPRFIYGSVMHGGRVCDLDNYLFQIMIRIPHVGLSATFLVVAATTLLLIMMRWRNTQSPNEREV